MLSHLMRVSRDALSLDVGFPGMLSHLMWGVPGACLGGALVVAVSGAGPVYVVVKWLFAVRGEMDPWNERHAAVLTALLKRITDL
nr:hypothetical protein GCM10017547_18070 [Pseudarthrobacter oxydans]